MGKIKFERKLGAENIFRIPLIMFHFVEHCFVVASGGDDGTLCIMHIHVADGEEKGGMTRLTTGRIVKEMSAHISSITGRIRSLLPLRFTLILALMLRDLLKECVFFSSAPAFCPLGCE